MWCPVRFDPAPPPVVAGAACLALAAARLTIGYMQSVERGEPMSAGGFVGDRQLVRLPV